MAERPVEPTDRIRLRHDVHGTTFIRPHGCAGDYREAADPATSNVVSGLSATLRRNRAKAIMPSS